MKTKSNSASLSPFSLKIIIVFLLGAIAYLSFTLIQLSSQITAIGHNTNSTQSITEEVPPNELHVLSNESTQFTHPVLNYNVSFPSSWKPQLFKSLAGSAVQPYKDFIVYSPDFAENLSSDNPGDTFRGASILIRGSETQYDTIEEKFKNNIVAQKIARNVIKTNVSGIPAIQYDYSVEGENATNLTFINGKFWYLVKYQYADEGTKSKYMNVFKMLVNSLKLNN